MKIVWISYEITFGWCLRQSLTNSIILRPNPMIWCPQAEIPLGWRLLVFQPLGTRSWDLAAIWWNFNAIHTIFIPCWGLSHRIYSMPFILGGGGAGASLVSITMLSLPSTTGQNPGAGRFGLNVWRCPFILLIIVTNGLFALDFDQSRVCHHDIMTSVM